MKPKTIQRFAIQNQITGELVTATTNSSPMFYRSAGLANAAMAARCWTVKQANDHEVVAVTITVGKKAE